MKRMLQLVLVGVFLLTSLDALAAARKEVRFDILDFRVEGNTVLPESTIQSVLAPYKGKDKDFVTVVEAVKALEKAYGARGWAAVRVLVPEQELENGIIRLAVRETRLGKIQVEGNKFFDRDNILAGLPDLRLRQPVNLRAVSSEIELVNENPAKNITMELSGGEKEDEIAALVKVKDEKPWKVGFTLDNSGDSKTGPARLGATFQHANLFNRDHFLALQYVTSPSEYESVNIFGSSYRIPVYALDGSIELFAAYSDVNSGSLALGGASSMQVTGRGTRLGIHFNKNLPRIGIYEQKISVGLDYRAYLNNVDFLGEQLGNDVTVHPFTFIYAGKLEWKDTSGGFYLGGAQNLPGTWDGKDSSSDFNRARSGAPDDYTVFQAGANVSQALPGDWQARAVVNAQYTWEPLVSGEQYGLGGAASVRGYNERELADDRGISASFEIYTPNLAPKLGIDRIIPTGAPLMLRGLLFYDVGYVNRADPLPGEAHSNTISSFGPGLRVTDGKFFTISSDLGIALEPIEAQTDRWDTRFHVALTVMF